VAADNVASTTIREMLLTRMFNHRVFDEFLFFDRRMF
jgi:hypothetical protein